MYLIILLFPLFCPFFNFPPLHFFLFLFSDTNSLWNKILYLNCLRRAVRSEKILSGVKSFEEILRYLKKNHKSSIRARMPLWSNITRKNAKMNRQANQVFSWNSRFIDYVNYILQSADTFCTVVSMPPFEGNYIDM